MCWPERPRPPGALKLYTGGKHGTPVDSCNCCQRNAPVSGAPDNCWRRKPNARRSWHTRSDGCQHDAVCPHARKSLGAQRTLPVTR
eukprot:scaffold67720_cov63-Phaeocystis_antarctica.AAC.4